MHEGVSDTPSTLRFRFCLDGRSSVYAFSLSLRRRVKRLKKIPRWVGWVCWAVLSQVSHTVDVSCSVTH